MLNKKEKLTVLHEYRECLYSFLFLVHTGDDEAGKNSVRAILYGMETILGKLLPEEDLWEIRMQEKEKFEKAFDCKVQM